MYKRQQIKKVRGEDVEIRVAAVPLERMAALGLGDYDEDTNTLEGDFSVAGKEYALRCVVDLSLIHIFNPGTEARAEGAATLTQADLDRVVQQTIARERRRAEAALEAARAEGCLLYTSVASDRQGARNAARCK